MAAGYAARRRDRHAHLAAMSSEVLNRPLFAIPSVAHLRGRSTGRWWCPFAVTGLAAAMSATAVVTTYQRLTDADWVRPDMPSIGRGVFGDGIAAIVAGLLGTYGLTISTANVGLVAATGVASRVIAFAVAALLVLAALQPTLIGILDHHAAARDGVGAVVHRGVHHDRRRADHLDACARRAPHAGDRHGHHGVRRGVGLSGGVHQRAGLGASARHVAAGAGDAGRADAQSRLPPRHPPNRHHRGRSRQPEREGHHQLHRA